MKHSATRSLVLTPAAVFALASLAGAQLSVTSVGPDRNALAVSTATNVTLTFDAPVDAASVSPSTFHVFGRWSGVRPGTYTVDGSTVTWRPDLAFFPGEAVTVSLSEGVQSTGGDPLTGGHAFHFWTRSNLGTDSYELVDVLSVRLDGEGFIQSYGIYAGDLDRDGSPDFSIPNEIANDIRVMRNDGCGSYTTPELTSVPSGSVPSANEGADLNADGYIDLAVANIGGDTVSVLLNDGTGSYLPSTTYPSGDASRGVAVLDLEGDGDADLAVALRNDSLVALHLNAGDGTFSPPSTFNAGVAGETSIIAVDANHDGLGDLFVGGYDSDNIGCLTNQGGGTFANTGTQSIPGHPWMLAAGDIDGDGNVDAASCNSSDSSASVVRGDGAGGLLPSDSYAVGFFPLAIDLGDTDGDGDLDLIASSYASGDWTYYQNDGTGQMVSPVTFDATFAGSCMILVDDDRDGDLDLIGIDEISDEIFLYRQVSPTPEGVQEASCDARMRVNNLAGYAGFWGLPPHPVSLDESAFLGMTTTASTAWAIGAGPALTPGLATTFGLLNLLPAYPLVSGVTDAYGEAQVAVALPPGIVPGTTVALQGFTFAGSLTNPETVRFVP
ncbi:MAG: FG-GAP-like repeat-containing protein [Planctomycetota bacterium]